MPARKVYYYDYVANGAHTVELHAKSKETPQSDPPYCYFEQLFDLIDKDNKHVGFITFNGFEKPIQDKNNHVSLTNNQVTIIFTDNRSLSLKDVSGTLSVISSYLSDDKFNQRKNQKIRSPCASATGSFLNKKNIYVTQTLVGVQETNTNTYRYKVVIEYDD
jgi:benzoyl-CoA reductase/2-hydroxyglutaryl-CoA dehydratase subunit BcrC/BadD/HgdB